MALNIEYENPYVSEAEYLSTELVSEQKREYIDGHVYAMTGASINHTRISGNILSNFSNHLKGTPCEAFMADVRVRLGKDYVYPDVLVDCNKIAGDGYFSTSPSIIVEVLSKSTKRLDLTTKLIKYINLPSVQEYVVIEQDSVSVQLLRRRKHWQPEYFFLGDTVTFEPINLTMTVEDIYDRVDNADMNEYRLEQLSS